MIKSSRQLKDKIRHLAKGDSARAQILLRNYMMERFLERVSLSEYRDKLILKGGMLVASMVGLDSRSTMDIDATARNMSVGVVEIECMVARIAAVPLNDGIEFRVKQAFEIMEGADYPGVRVAMEARFERSVTPLKVDISTGDAIVPDEVEYEYRLMFEDRSINVRAYSLETVLAEKMETALARSIANTRMRDFYDLHILKSMFGDKIDATGMRSALLAVTEKRGTAELLGEAFEALGEIRNDTGLRELWEAFRRKFSYAADLEWVEVNRSIRELFILALGGDKP